MTIEIIEFGFLSRTKTMAEAETKAEAESMEVSACGLPKGVSWHKLVKYRKALIMTLKNSL